MCEVFSILGSAILGSVGISGVSTAAATAVGVASTAATVGGLASTGLGVVNNARASRAYKAQTRSIQEAIEKQSEGRVTTAAQKTAAQLQDNTAPKRTLSSLRIPLTKTNSTMDAGQVNTTSTSTGLNIPM